MFASYQLLSSRREESLPFRKSFEKRGFHSGVVLKAKIILPIRNMFESGF